jgi:hypothetical protein
LPFLLRCYNGSRGHQFSSKEADHIYESNESMWHFGFPAVFLKGFRFRPPITPDLRLMQPLFWFACADDCYPNFSCPPSKGCEIGLESGSAIPHTGHQDWDSHRSHVRQVECLPLKFTYVGFVRTVFQSRSVRSVAFLPCNFLACVLFSGAASHA